jgi:cytochrome c-type biogenesis protein CcmF
MFATLMSILCFFVILMLFAANPFATTYSAPPADGEGLNRCSELLDGHSSARALPRLTGWSVPFAFVVAAGHGKAARRVDPPRGWVLVAWAFLASATCSGCSGPTELGWGGPWAWDPVENAAFLPWLTASAYVHSTMIQERRGMLKVWNVILICGTFFLTIFGTFLTRSGLIASVHSFAQSDLGNYFLVFIACRLVTFALIAWRLVVCARQRLGVVAAIVALCIGLLIDVVLLFSTRACRGGTSGSSGLAARAARFFKRSGSCDRSRSAAGDGAAEGSSR